MTARRQSVVLAADRHAFLPSDDGIDETGEADILSALMSATAALSSSAVTKDLKTVDQLSGLLRNVIANHLGSYLYRASATSHDGGQFAHFASREDLVKQEQANCAIWLALTVLDGEAHRVALAKDLKWSFGALASRFCPNPPTVNQVLACRNLPLSNDLAKMYGLAQQIYGDLGVRAGDIPSDKALVAPDAACRAMLSACFPTYIREFNGFVTLPSARLEALDTLPRKPEMRSFISKFLSRSLLVVATISVFVLIGFVLGWMYQGQLILASAGQSFFATGISA